MKSNKNGEKIIFSKWKDILAHSNKQLFEAMQEIDISVAKERNERTNLQIERWILFKLISTLSKQNQLTFPLTIKKSESPDFIITEKGVLKGLEITEAINPNTLKVRSLPEAKNIANKLDMGHFRWFEKHSLKSLRKIASKKILFTRAWVSDSVEREYADIIFDVVARKTITFQKSNYRKFSENILIIYVNVSLPILDTQLGATYCNSKLAQYWATTKFSAIFAVKDDVVTLYTQEGYRVYE